MVTMQSPSSPPPLLMMKVLVLCFQIQSLVSFGLHQRNVVQNWRQSYPLPTTHRPTSSMTVKASSADNGGSIRRSRRKVKEEITLYDILGASPKDTQEQLKLRYTSLVKRLHPDANPNIIDSDDYALSEINAAWEILGDKKERLRYDRQLQAKEFTEGFEAIVGLGIKTAIPWLKKTADTTVKAVDLTAAAVDASARAAQEGAEQAKLAYSVFELEQQIRLMEQKSAADREKAQRLQKEIDALRSKKTSSSSNDKRFTADFGSAEANRLLTTFQLDNVPSNLSRDLQSLQEMEKLMKESIRTTQSTQRELSLAVRKYGQTQKRLEEAEKALMKAQESHAESRQLQADAMAEDNAARNDLKKIEASLEKTREKVRSGLSQQQDLYISKRAKEMQAEKEKLIESANSLYREAQALMRQAQELER